MERNKLNNTKNMPNLITFVITFTCLILILSLSGCSWEESEEKQEVMAEQSQEEDTALNCPKQGMLQSDWSYCIELCLLDKSDATIHKELCERMCDQVEYYKGSQGLLNKIQSYKCSKCGECTEEQLKEIEEKRKQEEEQKIANQKEAEEREKQKEEEQRIKDEQLKIQEQEKLELEENIESQSEKLNGYVYIKNISGESRQFEENGVIYEFLYPAEEPTKVPVEVGRRLLTTGHFELVMV